jgi:uncharacterized NAD(P)/FAD-binding protein YdhS
MEDASRSSGVGRSGAVRRVAVLGGGAAGTLVAAELIRGAKRPLEVTLIEPRAVLGRGLAYATPFPFHLLNTRAARMSAYEHDPGHFVRWLRAFDPSADANSFAPRHVFGTYLETVLANVRAAARPGVRLAHVRDDVARVAPSERRVLISLKGGLALSADYAVLALGSLPGAFSGPLASGWNGDERLVGDPWAVGALDFADPDRPALLVGTGLTAVDAAITLYHRGHRGPIWMVSRRGLLPRAHGAAIGAADDLGDPELAQPTSARQLSAALRAQSRRAVARHGDWSLAVDRWRPSTQRLWAALAPGERCRFLRHLQPYWDVHRHRMPPAVAGLVRRMVDAGSLRVLAGRIVAVGEADGRLAVDIVPRGESHFERVVVGHVVNCSGPGPVRGTTHPLVARLLETGVVRPDPLGLGLDALADGTLLSRRGRAWTRLTAVGPLLKGTLWETTAVPEIRAQAVALAQRLARQRSLAGAAG